MPPPPDATILNYLNDSEKGRHYLKSLTPAMPPPPPLLRPHNT